MAALVRYYAETIPPDAVVLDLIIEAPIDAVKSDRTEVPA